MASERLPSRPACLLVASGAAEGVSAPSFFHCFTLASTAFNLQVATPGGKTMDFVDVNDSNARWVQDFRLKAYASPAKLESIDGARYHALLIPSCPGALVDLASSGSLARILQHFHSESKPICAVGHGVAALCCATSEDRSWVFQGYSVTGPVSLTLCTWCWTATWSPGRTPAPPSRPCRTCSSSAAAGSDEALNQAPSRCRHLQMSWVSPETLRHDTRPAWPLA
ncbi:glutamine amidotransferase-like class 1 domain-containing protein 1 isoform X1 [Muntiacus reevesi]|uniref:glutamine amidotransferase-like class 1 domain-containing protein 1 isoform X1 n=1 Tax=Muntiacus reevesi TaxID=9886 RepID=UPI0033071EB5